MDEALEAFLAHRYPNTEEMISWDDLRFEVRAYLCSELPPLHLVSSVRCVLLQGCDVLVVRDPQNQHILPGGRREAGEDLLQTLRREVLEETGWTFAHERLLGFRHFHHLTPRPENYPYPYPDFLQLIYTAQAQTFLPEAKEVGGYELEATFRPQAFAQTLRLPANEQLYLEAALHPV